MLQLEEGLVSTWGQFSGVVDVYTYVNKVRPYCDGVM
jgi:hypothetical protein